MNREELIWELSDNLDVPSKVYFKSEADSVMDEYEKRIIELEEQLENVQNTMYAENVDANMALVKANERIKELEAKLKEKDEVMTTCSGLIESASVMSKSAEDKLLNRIKELEAHRLKAVGSSHTAIN